jgi:hypothetical protein
MSTREPLVRNISDTALLAAIYRARETKRSDAVFRDPFARRLAGERGDQIAKSMPFSEVREGVDIPNAARFSTILAMTPPLLDCSQMSKRFGGGQNRVWHLAAFLAGLPSKRLEIDNKLPSNSR